MKSRLRRRSTLYIAIGTVGAFLAIALAMIAFDRTPTQYRATRELLFLVPPTVNAPDRVNPLLSFSSSLDTAMSVVAVTVSDEATALALAPTGSGLEYSVGPSGRPAPVMLVEAKAPTQSQAFDLADSVVTSVGDSLKHLQAEAKAPRTTWIVTDVISTSIEDDRLWKEQLQAAVVALGLGLLATGAALALVWRGADWAARRSQKG